MYVCMYVMGFDRYCDELIFLRKSVALPCCLFDLVYFFLPSFSHLSLKHVHIFCF